MNCSFTAGERMAPPEPRAKKLDRSYLSGLASSSSASGRAMASPTTVMVVTFSRSTMRQMPCGSNLRDDGQHERVALVEAA